MTVVVYFPTTALYDSDSIRVYRSFTSGMVCARSLFVSSYTSAAIVARHPMATYGENCGNKRVL